MSASVVVETAAAASACLGTIYKFRKMIWSGIRAIMTRRRKALVAEVSEAVTANVTEKLSATTDLIHHELQYNSGTSLKDTVRSIKMTQDYQIKGVLEGINDKLGALMERQDVLKDRSDIQDRRLDAQDKRFEKLDKNA